MKEKIKIIDESGDKKYFSQLPHYILNHSTAIDQALYWQMKRYAGENGRCFATQETLMKKMGIGRKLYNKSLEYLLDKKWIRFIGLTKGKTRPIRTYAIVDIWKLNIEHYEEIPSESTVSFKEEIPSESNIDTAQKNSKIPSESTVEEELTKEYIYKDIAANAAPEVFSLKDELIKLKNDPKRHIQLIGEYLEERGAGIESKEQLKVAIGRHLRAAVNLAKFSDKQVAWASGKAAKEYPEWTLETCVKLLVK